MPMLVPPVATGAVERDDISAHMSANGRPVMSDRSQGRESKQSKTGQGTADFNKAYNKVSQIRSRIYNFEVSCTILTFFVSFLARRRYGYQSRRW